MTVPVVTVTVMAPSGTFLPAVPAVPRGTTVPAVSLIAPVALTGSVAVMSATSAAAGGGRDQP
ncbi:hypothetical protein SAVIM338S_06230 [Streptomyces avidinii]